MGPDSTMGPDGGPDGGPLLRALCVSMGERRAFAHVERILQLHRHSGACLSGESAAMPARRAEKELLARLRGHVAEYGLDIALTDSASSARSGDILARSGSGTIGVWDSKDYVKAVPWAQVRKLARDVRVQGGCFGVIVAPKGVARIGMHGVCDGVPIHVCAPGSVSEFACLYLTLVQGASHVERTANAAHAAHVHDVVGRLQSTLNELKATLCQ